MLNLRLKKILILILSCNIIIGLQSCINSEGIVSKARTVNNSDDTSLVGDDQSTDDLSSSNPNYEYEDFSVLADYGDSWSLDTDGHIKSSKTPIWLNIDGDHGGQEASISKDIGVKGSSAKVNISSYGDDGLFKVLFGYDYNRYSTIQAAKGHNRLKLHVTIPYAGNGNNHTFHIGTYVKNPEIAHTTSDLGWHYYHYYYLRGSKANYWTKMYMDERPQHSVGQGDLVVPNNPTSTEEYDYISGLSRIYLQMRYSPLETNWKPYSMYLDEIDFYTETRLENNFNINSVCITYQGAGEFDIDWYLQQKTKTNDDNSVFEIRYAYSPINTQQDYDNALLPNNMPEGGIPQLNLKVNYGHRRSIFTIPNIDETKRIYFAIKDMNVNKPQELKRVDYFIYPDVPRI